MTRLELMVYKLRPVRAFIDLMKRTDVPGIPDFSFQQLGRFFFRELRNLKINERAAAVTYNFLMAMPPTFLFLFSLIPYLPLKNVTATILNTLELLTPNHHIYQSVEKIVIDFINTQRNDVLSFGVILVLFFSSNGIMGLMRSFDASMTLYKKRTSLQRRWTAIKLTMLILGVAIISLGVLIVQTEILDKYVLRIFHSIVAVKILSIVILVIVVFFAICIIYTYGPSLSHRFNFISAGSVFAAVLSLVVSSIFFFLVNHFINYNKVYGSIGTLIAFMVWVWLNTLIILIGYELNVSLLLGKITNDAVDDSKKNT